MKEQTLNPLRFTHRVLTCEGSKIGIITLSGRPGGNFVALVTLIETLICEIFANDAYKPSNVPNGKVSMFSNELSVKYTNPWLAVSNQSFVS